MTDPTTPAGRAELRELIARGSARAVFGWMIEHGPALLDALDEAEAAIARVRALAYSTAVGYSEEERILAALDGDS